MTKRFYRFSRMLALAAILSQVLWPFHHVAMAANYGAGTSADGAFQVICTAFGLIGQSQPAGQEAGAPQNSAAKKIIWCPACLSGNFMALASDDAGLGNVSWMGRDDFSAPPKSLFTYKPVSENTPPPNRAPPSST